MMSLVRRVGKRLHHALHQTADTRAVLDEDWCRLATWYSKAMTELKRHADSLPEPKAKITDAEYEAELGDIAREQVQKMTPAERREWLQAIEQGLSDQATNTATLHRPSVLAPAPDRWTK